MEGMNFFELFGMGEETGLSSLTSEDGKTTKKKNLQKTNVKKDAGKKAAGKGNKDTDFFIQLPVDVKARGFRTTLEGNEKIQASQAIQRLFNSGYEEVAIPGIDIAYDKTCSVLYVTEQLSPNKEDASARLDELPSITIVDGFSKCELTAENFSAKDADEIVVSDLTERWVNQNPRYNGCRLLIADKYAYPCFSVPLAESTEIPLPSEFFFNGESITFTDNDFKMDKVTVKDVIAKIIGENNTVVRLKIYTNDEKSCYFVSYQQIKTTSTEKGDIRVVKTPEKKVAVKYHLPLNVFLAFIGKEYHLTTADFGGKEKVVIDDVKKYFAAKFKIFSDSTRNLDWIYIPEENYLSLMFTSGRKGSCAPNTLTEEYPIGTFVLTKDQHNQIQSIRFRYSLPKIPAKVLRSIISYFKEDMDKEAYVKICYNKPLDEYFIVKGNIKADRLSVAYTLPRILNDRNIIQVMDIHSHNRMDAFFSAVDDIDECYPGIFGVIGKIDTERISMQFRAGYEGCFISLDMDALFEEV